MTAALTYEPTAGEHLTEACKAACRKSRICRSAVEMNFNGATVVAQPDTKPDELERMVYAVFRREHDEYWTPQRKDEQAAKEARECKSLDDHIGTLSDINWDDAEDVCEWLCRFSELKFIHTPSPSSSIIDAFAAHGYHADVNLMFDGESSEEWSRRLSVDAKWRYVIGQAISGIGICGCPHPMVQEFSERIRNGMM